MLSPELYKNSMKILCEIYDREPSIVLMEGYYMALKDMTDEEFEYSMITILKERKFASLPKPAEILEYAQPDIDSLSVLIIRDIENTIRNAGMYQSVSFEDKVVNSVIDAFGGWKQVCAMKIDEWKWAKKEIPKLYKVYRSRRSHPSHVAGIPELKNESIGAVLAVPASYKLPKRALQPMFDNKKSMNLLAYATAGVRV